MSLPRWDAAAILTAFLFIFFSLSLYIKCRTIHKNKKSSSLGITATEDNYLTARDSQPWWSIGLALYASGMGCWILFAVAETGVLAGLLGIIFYGLSNGLPFFLMVCLAPKVKNQLKMGRGFILSDFYKLRYGNITSTIVSITSVFFMFIFLTAELTSIGEVFSSLSVTFPYYAAICAIGTVTLLFSIVGGAPVAIVSDRIEGLLILCLSIVTIFTLIHTVSSQLNLSLIQKALKPTAMGYQASTILLIAVTTNQFLDQSMWQKVFAAKSNKDIHYGFSFAALLILPTVIAFGIPGILAVSIDVDKKLEGQEFLAFFYLLSSAPAALLYVVLALAVSLVYTTIAALQCGLIALFSSELKGFKNHIFISRICCILVNVFAMFLAYMQYSVLKLFLTSNIISCAIVPSLALAFWKKSHEVPALIGMLIGILSIFCCGFCFAKSVADSFLWIFLPYGPYALETMLTFLIVPTVTFVATIISCFVLKKKNFASFVSISLAVQK